MPGRSLNVVQPHNLGIEVAKVRLLKAANDRKASNPHITTGDFYWHSATSTFTVDANAYGTPVHVVVHIEADKVTVISDAIAGVFVVVYLGVLEANREIKVMLAEALK